MFNLVVYFKVTFILIWEKSVVYNSINYCKTVNGKDCPTMSFIYEGEGWWWKGGR